MREKILIANISYVFILFIMIIKSSKYQLGVLFILFAGVGSSALLSNSSFKKEEGWLDNNTLQIKGLGSPGSEENVVGIDPVILKQRALYAAYAHVFKQIVDLLGIPDIVKTDYNEVAEFNGKLPFLFSDYGEIVYENYHSSDNSCEIYYKIQKPGLKQLVSQITKKNFTTFDKKSKGSIKVSATGISQLTTTKKADQIVEAKHAAFCIAMQKLADRIYLPKLSGAWQNGLGMGAFSFENEQKIGSLEVKYAMNTDSLEFGGFAISCEITDQYYSSAYNFYSRGSNAVINEKKAIQLVQFIEKNAPQKFESLTLKKSETKCSDKSCISEMVIEYTP